ncbi:hypothetical protein ITJ38_05550 [Agreia pratensis]|uniref:hypothetical protein n=1 Tax=Microbacteriaceae TaxID=85023 RepID=UPI00188A52A1|nr:MULTISPECIES: hypothetical protein [Microbacteriaceae]MBF4561250.1 hypothetical protein [Microbacterium sp. VKM Ac-2870]MBF4633861.1 hypothetical protein [Agreia pratensis]
MDQPTTARTFPVSAWLTIDASLDNAVQAAGEELDDPVRQARLRSIRQAGWAASAIHPQSGHGFGGWPPNDAELSIPLTGSNSESIRQILDKDLSTYRELAERDPRFVEEIALIAEARRWID